MNGIKANASHALKAARWIGRGAYAIAAVGTVASYGTQVALLLAHEVGAFAYVLPATVDVLAIIAAMALQLPNLDKVSRRIAAFTLLVAVGVSITANLAGGHNTVARIAHAWPVAAYLLGELLANRVRAYAARLADAATPVPAIVTTATVSAPIVAPVTTTATPPAAIAAPVIVAAPIARPVMPARPRVATPARSPRPRTVTANVPATPINPRTGLPYSKRHARRLATGK